MRLSLKTLVAFASLLAPVAVSAQDETDVQAKPAGESELWIEFKGGKGPGADRHIVFVTGDEEYRSEEGMPQLAKILAKHHGFRWTSRITVFRLLCSVHCYIARRWNSCLLDFQAHQTPRVELQL